MFISSDLSQGKLRKRHHRKLDIKIPLYAPPPPELGWSQSNLMYGGGGISLDRFNFEKFLV